MPSCESTWQTIHMNCQDLFPKRIYIYIYIYIHIYIYIYIYIKKWSAAVAVVTGALRVKSTAFYFDVYTCIYS